MASTATFTCSIGTTNPDAVIGLEIWFDGDQIYNTEHLDRTVDLEQIMSDYPGQHELRFVMKNKTAEHTKLDAQGHIIRDSCLTITDPAFDNIQLGHIFFEQVRYCHDFNGTQESTETQFFGIMGCNGVVSLQFTTPIHQWLLEHMQP